MNFRNISQPRYYFLSNQVNVNNKHADDRRRERSDRPLFKANPKDSGVVRKTLELLYLRPNHRDVEEYFRQSRTVQNPR